MEIKKLYSLYLKNRIICTDSRNIIPGCIFFALKGDNFNGNQFAYEAIQKGAIASVVDEETDCQSELFVKVDNVLHSLQQLARFHREQSAVTILAITGSNGKTTTKELCNMVLSVKYKVHATAGNLNNHIGVPLTLLSMTQDTQVAIIEMGANHHGEIAALCEIAFPDYGVITNIGKAHLEGFGGIHGVAQAKGELFQYLVHHNKTLFLNEGNPYLPPLVDKEYKGIVRYNSIQGLWAENINSNPLLNFTLKGDKLSVDIKTNLVGSYNVENVLAACTVGVKFGIPVSEIVTAVQSYIPRNNRSQLIRTGRNLVYMDAYNANPSSMTAAIHEFLRFEGKNKLLILGEMREVGDNSSKEHEDIVQLLKDCQAANVIFVGKSFENIAVNAGFRYVTSVEQLSEILKNDPLENYFVFVKGSRSNRLEKILALL